MSDYEFTCNQCGGSILADESVQGSNINCPHCDKLLTAPPRHAAKPFNISSPSSRHSTGGQRKKFKVEVVQEGALGTLLVGSSKIPQAKLEAVLNQYGTLGWDLEFMIIEKRRLLLLWIREAVIITLSKPC